MKKFLLVSILISCVAFTFGQKGTIELKSSRARQECTNSSINGFNAEFSFSEIQSANVSTEKGTFSAITISNTFPTGYDGTPEIPAARKLIAVPQGATPKVIVKNYSETEYNLSEFGISTLYPHQPSLRKDVDSKDVKFVYNASSYAKKGFEERPIAQVEVLGTMRGVRIGSLTVNPVIYNASTNTIIVRNNIEVEVVFEGADQAATKSLYEKTFSIYFEPIYNELFNRDVYEDHPDLYNTPVRMLVIAPDAFAETLQPWLDWKLQKGFYLDVHYTSETGTSYNDIKNFVYSKYEAGLETGEVPTFLNLIGDTPQIPGTQGSSSGKVTDLYYSTVDGDYFPDMFCSRMCCSNTTELQNTINKILCYEKVEGDTAYLASVLLIAGSDSNWNPQVGQPAINYANEYHFNEEHGYTDVHKYLSTYTNCYSWLNSGVGLVNYTAHGGETGWSGPSFSVSDANALTNVNKYFLAIGNCCLAADFGYNGVSLGEAMIRAQNKGAYTYIGSCPSTYWYEDYYWGVGATNVMSQTPSPENSSTGVYDGLNMLDKYNTTNSIVFLGNLAVCYAHDGAYGTHSSPLYYWQSYHCLGDGSIMPFNSGIPTQNTVSHMDIVPIGMDYYEVSAEPGSYVALSKDGILYGTAVVDSTGTVNVPLNPVITSGGLARLVVTKPNFYPVIEDIQCAALDGPYIIGNGWVINDADNNGVFDYSETGTIDYSIKNVGSETAGNVIITISSDDPYVTFNDFSADFGSIDANAITTVEDAFTVTISPDVPNHHVVECLLTITNEGEQWTSLLNFTTNAPIISLISTGVEGELLPGQTLNITATFINTGSADVYNAYGVYSTDCEYITINTVDPVSYGFIRAEGGTATGAFSITVSPDAPFGTVIPSTVTLTADYGYSQVGEFEPFIDICNVAISDFPYNEGYEEGEIPNCWTQEIVEGDGTWIVRDGGVNFHPYHAHTGEFNACVAGNDLTIKLVSPTLNLVNVNEPTLTFWHAQANNEGKQDMLKVYYKNATDGDWILLASYQFSLASWKEREIPLPNVTSNYYIAFEADCNGGYGVVVDDIHINGSGSSIIGDADGNGVVNVLDASVTVNYMLAGQPDPFYFENADVNADNKINVIDVMGIVNIIMNDGDMPILETIPTAVYTIENGFLYIDSPVAIGGIQFNLISNETINMNFASNIQQNSAWTSTNNYTCVAYSLDGTMLQAGKNMICNIKDAQLSEIILSDPFGREIITKDGGILGLDDYSTSFSQPYPNPFTTSLNLSYTISEANSAEFVMTNANGQIVDRMSVDYSNGNHTITWTPSNSISSGVYFITLSVDGINIQTSKVVYNK